MLDYKIEGPIKVIINVKLSYAYKAEFILLLDRMVTGKVLANAPCLVNIKSWGAPRRQPLLARPSSIRLQTAHSTAESRQSEAFDSDSEYVAPAESFISISDILREARVGSQCPPPLLLQQPTIPHLHPPNTSDIH